MDKNENTLKNTVLKLEQEFISGTGTLMSKYVRTDLYEDINKIYAYLESKHISGESDSIGREKPFFNIVLAIRNIWFRATDIDRKNILLKATKEKDIYGTFFLNVFLQNWMREERFGTFLNTWGIELAGFNSAVVKFVEKDGRLIPSVIPWSRLIVDQVNFDANIKIELLELTESELYKKGYDEDQVKALCDSTQTRQLTSKEQKDTKKNYYKLYEVHGELPLSYLTGKEKDEDTFVQQMQVLSFVASDNKDEQQEFVLYKGKEEKDPYMLTSLLPTTDGSISLNGSVKNSFEAQWMTNHTAKQIKDQLDLASKLIFQTSDQNFIGQNALFAIESGDIMVHQPNQPLTQINNNSHDVTSLMNYGQQWKQLSSEINGISESMLGANPPSGTAWRQTEALLQESHSLFEIMIENKGLHLEDMIRKFILPFLMKKMNNNKEITGTLDLYGIKQIEERYIKNTAIKINNRKIVDAMLGNGIQDIPDLSNTENNIKTELNAQGNQRFFAPSEVSWKKEFEDLEVNTEVEITGESSDKQAVLTTLNTALQLVLNPNFANNPKAQFVFDKILTQTGTISPVELSSIPAPVASPATPSPVSSLQQTVTPPGGAVGAA